MQGRFDESSDFGPLLVDLGSACHIDFKMEGVSYMSSAGVASWCLFLSKLSSHTTYSFRNCSVAFVSSSALIPMVTGRGEVVSVQAPYYCRVCDREDTHLVESAIVHKANGALEAPILICHICANELEFDDLPERYFAFLTT